MITSRLPKIGMAPLKFDLLSLQQATDKLLSQHPLDNITNQLALTHRPECHKPFYDGLGTLFDFQENRFRATENEFTEFNRELFDTYFHQIYSEVAAWSPFPLGRVRIMRLNPKSCLSMHVDTEIRYHLPIFTNMQCYMIFLDALPTHIPATGQLYWTNTLGPHSVLNGHQSDARYHLVFSTYAPTVDCFYDFLNQQASTAANQDFEI